MESPKLSHQPGTTVQKEMSGVTGEGKAYWRQKAALPSLLISRQPRLALYGPPIWGTLCLGHQASATAVYDAKSHWDTDLTFQGCGDGLQKVV